MGFTEFQWVLPSFSGFYRVSVGFTELFYYVDLVLPSFTEFYRGVRQWNGGTGMRIAPE